jgi:2'-5' RNA ligase
MRRSASSPARPRHELLFFGVLPPRPVAARILGDARNVQRRSRIHGRLRPAEVLHITLCGIEGADETRPGAVVGAKHAAWSVCASPFDLTLDRYESWSPHHVMRPSESPGLMRLHRSLEGAVHELVPGFSPSAFAPHMTFLYGEPKAPPGFLNEPITWTVEDFVLVRSFQGETRYECLGRYRLDG